MFNQPLAVVGALPNNRVVVINIFSSSYKISGWVWNIRGYTAEIVAVARIVGSKGSGLFPLLLVVFLLFILHVALLFPSLSFLN